jgi:imidazolonepropionase-like amidohydrolase
MATIFALIELGRTLGFPRESQEKMKVAHEGALAGMERMRQANVKVGFGTDLLGVTYVRECTEFTLRRDVFSPLEILRQCTSVNAEMMQMAGQIGCVAPGAHADLLVVDGDPLADIGVMAADGRNVRVIVRAGELLKNEEG